LGYTERRVAALALLFTVGSFWWIHARRGRLRCYTSHVYSGAYAAGKLVLVLPLVLHNPAPAPLVVPICDFASIQ
jgi:hypothetical protein